MDNWLQSDCCGCGLCGYMCSVNAISMERDKYGFLQPVVDREKCIECGACAKVCIFKNPIKGVEPVAALLTAHKDYQVQMDSSSGGAFTAICQAIAKAHPGSIITYYGAAWQQDFSVAHERVSKLEDIVRFRKSKYLQSEVYRQFENICTDLAQGKIVVFSGTPCQIAAISRTVKRNNENLYTIDLVCNGIGSPKAFQNYLANKYGEVSSVDMRHKDFYHGNIFYKWFEVVTAKGKKCLERMNYYLSAYYAGEFNREDCFNCPYACKERISDFTIGDIHSSYPQLNQEEYKNGVSVMLLNTPKSSMLKVFLEQEMAITQVQYEDIFMKSRRLREAGQKPSNYPEMLEYVTTQNTNHDNYIKRNTYITPMWKQKFGEWIPEFVWKAIKR